MTTDQTKVAIVAGDPLAGRTLETLLQGGGYCARCLYKFVEDELGELLTDSRVLLIVPPLWDECSSVLRDVMCGPAAPNEIAVLKLLPVNGTEKIMEGEGALFWPCPTEELRRAIEAVLNTNK